MLIQFFVNIFAYQTFFFFFFTLKTITQLNC